MTETATAAPLVGTEWLAARLGSPDLKIVDASWYLPAAARNTAAEYKMAHIPGARFFDIDVLSDTRTKLPHMLPLPEVFAAGMCEMGIGSSDFVVAYDSAGIYSAARAWWMLLAMGHTKCAVLDGGLPKWRRESRPVTTTPPERMPGHFVPQPCVDLYRNFKQIKANLQCKDEQIADARSRPRFRGEEAEPRPGVQPGHIPGSANIHYAELLAPDGTMRSRDELRALFAARGIDLARPVVTLCGSGVTAAILFLAARIAGAPKVSLYDGSWAEWGAAPDAPIATGLPAP